MDEDRVKDPLGQCEKNMPIFRDAKPGDDLKLAGLIAGTVACVALVSYSLHRLFG